ncbi:hypothetical protein AMTRI_Chr06g169210 [Amborella trichopoda]
MIKPSGHLPYFKDGISNKVYLDNRLEPVFSLELSLTLKTKAMDLPPPTIHNQCLNFHNQIEKAENSIHALLITLTACTVSYLIHESLVRISTVTSLKQRKNIFQIQ